MSVIRSIQRTASFMVNIRRETVPGLTEPQYEDLLKDLTVEVSEETAAYLFKQGYAVKSGAPPLTEGV